MSARLAAVAAGSGADEPQAGELIVDLDGFEGPISLLLMLAREQKLDLKRISILALADQYLAFIAKAHRLRLELAGDCLVMAAWLAYLKSRLLLPEPAPDDEPSAVEMAEALAFRLRRLAAMQEAGQALLARPRLGIDVHVRAVSDQPMMIVRTVYEACLHDLLRAYSGLQAQDEVQVLHIRPPAYYSVEDALERLNRLLGLALEWRSLESFLPPQLLDGPVGRSRLAATFAATLELVKDGRAEVRQESAFGPIWLRAARPRA